MAELWTEEERKLIGEDPYWIWRGLEVGARLPRKVVVAGLAHWFGSQLEWIWQQQTEVKIPWYREQRDGQRGWCAEEAKALLNLDRRDSYSAVDFYTLHMKESLRKNGVKALRDAFWSDLLLHKQAAGDLQFFTNLHLLIGQQPHSHHQGKRLFTVLWDVAALPLRYWTYSAIELYLEEIFAQRNLLAISPNAATIKVWAHRLSLHPFRPAIVTRYIKGKGIPEDGFNPAALILAKIPVPQNVVTPEF